MTQAQQPEALEDFKLRKMAALGPVHASSGLVERRPAEYRRELEDQFVRGFRAAESRQRARIKELEAQLYAIGAGGVEPLRSRQCLHQIAEPGGWISVNERLPDPGTAVLLDIGKKTPIRAMWAAKHSVEAHDEADPGWCDYDEATDTYYCPEGWYEWNEHEEVHWAVSATPRAWMPLPSTSSADEGGSNG